MNTLYSKIIERGQMVTGAVVALALMAMKNVWGWELGAGDIEAIWISTVVLVGGIQTFIQRRIRSLGNEAE